MNKNRKRLTAAFLTALIVFMILLTACAVVVEATHDCGGADCDVCRIIGTIIGVIHSLSVAMIVISVIVMTDPRRFLRCFNSRNSVFVTPVTEKDRLLN